VLLLPPGRVAPGGTWGNMSRYDATAVHLCGRSG
jgi:hypothetical protein